VRHRLGLATRTQISVCKSPFPSAGTAVSLFRVKTVQQRPLLPREVRVILKFHISKLKRQHEALPRVDILMRDVINFDSDEPSDNIYSITLQTTSNLAIADT